MDFDREWTAFALDAEFDVYGASRIASAHNALRARVAEVERERDELIAGMEDVCSARNAREAECAELRPFAAFGSWVFEGFWHDGEPGDIEAYDAQEKAVEFGLLGRTSEVDPAATHAEECDCSPEAPAAECCCFTPTRKPLDIARLLPATQAQGENERGNG